MPSAEAGERARAVVVGAGWAGEGHTLALRYAGVDVVAICARTPEVVRDVAARLEIPEASTDWRETLRRVRPEIVSLATPASLRLEVIEEAAALGAHLFCDKPLGATAAEAEAAYHAVSGAGVKSAYAATHRYDPSVAWLAELVREGTVGQVSEILATYRSTLPALFPWSWAHTLAGGGGMLNNMATHRFAILERVAGGRIVRAAGHARGGGRAPVVPGLHDFRHAMAKGRELTPELAASLEWREIDADLDFSALLAIDSPAGESRVTLTSGRGPHAPGEVNRTRIYGETGLLVVDGAFSDQKVTLVRPGAAPEELPTPERLRATLPQLGSDVFNKWAALACDFVADVRGEPHEPYLTFHDGWRYQVAIDAIRDGAGWAFLPVLAAAAAAVPA